MSAIVDVQLPKSANYKQCCQMVYFRTKNSNLGKIFEGLSMEDVGICTAILSILLPNGIFYGHLVHFVIIWYTFSRVGILYRENSGSPDYKIKVGARFFQLVFDLHKAVCFAAPFRGEIQCALFQETGSVQVLFLLRKNRYILDFQLLMCIKSLCSVQKLLLSLVHCIHMYVYVHGKFYSIWLKGYHLIWM
jgi:hypothetical protein